MGPFDPAPFDDASAAWARMRGGVLLAYEREGVEARAFIPADVALRLTALSAMTEVPGCLPPARGIALADGEVVTVLELGRAPAAEAGKAGRAGKAGGRWAPQEDWPVPGSDRALLCLIGGQKVALLGGRVLSTGMFDRHPFEDGVLFRGQSVRTLDVRALYAQAETAIWAPRPSSPAAQEESGGST